MNVPKEDHLKHLTPMEEEMPVTATDERAARWEAVIKALRKFGISQEKIGTVLSGRDTRVVLAAANWLEEGVPGLRSLRLMRGIAHQTVGSEHDQNLAYLERNKAIPTLPQEVIARQMIGDFFMAAREILRTGNPTCYKALKKPPT